MSLRKPLQRALLALLGALLLFVGGRTVGAALAHAGPHEVEHRVERVASVGVAVRAVAARDVFYDETFAVREGGRLTLDLGAENAVVKTVDGPRARVVIEGRGDDAASEFARRRFSAAERGGDLVVRTDPPRERWRGSTDASFTVTVEVPRRYAADLDLGSGNVELATLVGDVTIDVGSGNVDVADVVGDRVLIDTGSGNVRARALRGDVRIDTGSGNVEVDRVDGSLEVDTGSGRVSVGAVAGPVAVDTGSGRVDLTLETAAPVDVDTGSGGVTVRVPAGAGFDLDLDGGSVRIDGALGFRGSRERDEARGTVGGGGPALRLSAGSGAVEVAVR